MGRQCISALAEQGLGKCTQVNMEPTWTSHGQIVNIFCFVFCVFFFSCSKPCQGTVTSNMADDVIVITPDILHVEQVSHIVSSPSAGAISLFVGTVTISCCLGGKNHYCAGGSCSWLEGAAQLSISHHQGNICISKYIVLIVGVPFQCPRDLRFGHI